MALRRTNGVAIREIRIALGITQERLAIAAGVDKSAICRIEAGTQPRSFDTVRKIATRLGVPVDAITYPVAQAEGVAS